MDKCGSLTKSCRRCGHRYPKGDRETECPECGEARPCRNPAGPNGRCRIHGGRSLFGAAHPAFKDGRRSTYLKGVLRSRFAEASRDPELTEYDPDLALLEVRLSRLLESEGPVPDWEELEAVRRQIREALDREDPRRLRDGLGLLEEMVDRGLEDVRRWKEIDRILARRTRILAASDRRAAQREEFISRERLTVIMSAVGSMIVSAAQSLIGEGVSRETVRRFQGRLSEDLLKLETIN